MLCCSNATAAVVRSTNANSIAAQFDKLQQAHEATTLWGRPFLKPDEKNNVVAVPVLEAIARFPSAAFDPLFEQLLPSTALRTSHEDVFGTDLHSSDERLRAASEALFKTERGAQFYAALRRSRGGGGAGSTVGLARLQSEDSVHSVLDEADRADTTWARDSYFTNLAATVHDITGVAASNVEGLLSAVRRATADQMVRIYSTRALQPYSMLPYVPCDAGWALAPDSDELKAWCALVHKARAEADAFMEGPVRAASSKSGWPKVAAELAAQREKIGVVLARRRERLFKSLPSPADVARREAAAAVESETTGEFDAAGADNSEEFLLEHDEIEKLADEPIPSAPGVTYRLVWLHSDRFEALLHQHVSSGAGAVQLRADCIARAWHDLGGSKKSKIEEEIVASIKNSEFDSRGAFIVPSMTRGWVMLNWHRFGASGAVVQHSPGSSSRVLLARAKTLTATEASARLYFKLKPLSSAIELSTPFQQRKSLVTAVSEYLALGADKAGQERSNMALEALDAKRAELREAVRLVTTPMGAARRAAYAARRVALTRDDVPLSKVEIAAGGAWAMGSRRNVRFSWPTPLLDVTPAEAVELSGQGARAATPEGAIIREASRLRTCITVALFRRKTAAQLQAEKRGKEQHVAQLQQLSAKEPRVVDHILTQSQRVTAPTDGGSSSGDIKAAIALWLQPEEWEFVSMLDDAVHIYPTGAGGSPDTIHEISVRLPFLPPSQPVEAAAAAAGSEYRLELRAFDLTVNPQRLPTRYVSAHSPAFTVEDVVPRVIKSAAHVDVASPQWMADGAGSSPTIFAGHRLVEVCSGLRAAGVEVPLMLEFEAGQHLTAKGEVILSHFLHLLSAPAGGAGAKSSAVTNYFAHSGPDRDLTDVQLAAEPAVRRHYALHHPGLSAQEWAESRRPALEQAMAREAEWWRQDSILQLAAEELSPVASPPAHRMASTVSDATLRYARDTCQVLSAAGRDGMQDDAAPPVATVALRGDGTTVALSIDQAVVSERGMKLEQVLEAVKSATNAAHVRLNTLAAARNGLTEELAQRAWVDHADSTDLGGVYGPTMLDCYRRALRHCNGEARQLEMLADGERPASARTAMETEPEERYASKENPELRRTRFHAAAGPMMENADEVPLEHQNPWS